MTTPTLIDGSPVQAPMTADAFLFGAGPATADALGRAIGDLDVTRTALRPIRRLSTSAVALVNREIGAVTDDLLELDLGDVLLSAWQKYSKLTDAARRTLAVGHSEEIVPLAAHTVRSTYSPHIDLVVGEVMVHSFKFELEIVFELTALQAIVRAGTLAALSGGECVLTVTLYLDGIQLAKTERAADLELMVRLHPPRPLLTRPSIA